MSTKIKNGLSYKKNGWTYISIKGKPKERGYAYGFLCANDFKDIQKMLHFLMMESYGMEWDYFIKEIANDFKEMTKRDFIELYEEMRRFFENGYYMIPIENCIINDLFNEGQSKRLSVGLSYFI